MSWTWPSGSPTGSCASGARGSTGAERRRRSSPGAISGGCTAWSRGSYCESFGCPELEPIRGAPQIFVIGGNGTGIPVYRRLQRQGVPFAAGILPENDVDHPVASALAVEVIAQRAYHPIGEDTFQRALSVLERCSQVLCCLREFGPLNEANRRLAQAGGDGPSIWMTNRSPNLIFVNKTPGLP